MDLVVDHAWQEEQAGRVERFVGLVVNRRIDIGDLRPVDQDGRL